MSNWLKRGKVAHETLKQDEKQAERRAADGVYRFYLKDEEQAEITFLDGDLGEDGLLDIPMYYEHQLNLNGKWGNFFVCLADEDEGTECPICVSGDNRYLAAVMTVVDHRKVEYKGKVYQDQKKLFVAKRHTIKTLQIIAAKRGGLAGCRFDVARTGDKAANVGSLFDFTDKQDVADIMKKYKVEPYDYKKILPYHTADQLRELGIGSGTGAASSGGEQTTTPAGDSYDEDL
jgi:hypothetical protein